MEEWRDIEGFDGIYQVSNTGKIRSLSYNRTGIIKNKTPHKSRKGKMEINLWKGNKAYPKTVARLVYETFSGNKLSDKQVIQYADSNAENCSYENLYTISKTEMLERDYDNGKRKLKLGKFDFYGEYISTRDAIKMAKINYNTLLTRLTTLKWNIYEAVETPVAMNRRRVKGGKEYVTTKY